MYQQIMALFSGTVLVLELPDSQDIPSTVYKENKSKTDYMALTKTHFSLGYVEMDNMTIIYSRDRGGGAQNPYAKFLFQDSTVSDPIKLIIWDGRFYRIPHYWPILRTLCAWKAQALS